MMRRLTNIVLLVVAIFLGSCTREHLNSQPSLDKGDVQIKLTLPGVEALQSRATVNGTPQEDAIHSVQLIIYDGETFFKQYEFSVDHPISTNNVVWDIYTQTITMRNLLVLGHSYNVYAVVNTTINNVSTMTKTVFKQQVVTNAQPVAPPTDAQGLVMTGMQEGFTFTNLGTVMTMNLTRLAAKVRISVTTNLGIPPFQGVTLLPDKMVMRVLNVPNQSYFYNFSPAIPSSVTMADLNNLTFTNGVLECYLPENPLSGTSDQTKKNATQFILQLPYSYTDINGFTKQVDNN
ncbi:MAG: fimbrial protein, partial [Mucinivorans sp.]